MWGWVDRIEIAAVINLVADLRGCGGYEIKRRVADQTVLHTCRFDSIRFGSASFST